MKNVLINISLFFLISFTFFSCQRDYPVPEDALLSVPGNVSMVMAVNIPQMMEKADFEAVKEMAFFQDMLREVKKENAPFAAILENPERSGIDLSHNAYLSLQAIPNSNEEENFVSLHFSMADIEAFEKMLQDIDVNFAPAKTTYGIAGEGSSSILVWNEKVVILGVGEPESGIRSKVETYLNTPPEQSVAQNKNLRRCLAQDFDLASWMTSDMLAGDESVRFFSRLASLSKEDLMGNYIQSFGHFEEGAIRGEAYFFLKKKLTTDLDLFFRDKVKTDFTAKVPAEGLAAMMTAAFDLKGMNQVLIEKANKGTVEEGLKPFGLRVDDLHEALGGDIMLALYANEKELLKTNGLFAANIRDQKGLDKLLDFAIEKQLIEKQAEDLYLLKGYEKEIESDSGVVAHSVSLDAKLLLKDGLLYISGSEDLITKIRSGQFKTEGKVNNSMAKMAANIFAGFVDFNTFTKIDDEFEALELEEMKLYTSRKKAEGIISLQDKEVNSLKLLFQRINEEYLKKQEQEKKIIEKEMEEDRSI